MNVYNRNCVVVFNCDSAHEVGKRISSLYISYARAIYKYDFTGALLGYFDLSQISCSLIHGSKVYLASCFIFSHWICHVETLFLIKYISVILMNVIKLIMYYHGLIKSMVLRSNTIVWPMYTLYVPLNWANSIIHYAFVHIIKIQHHCG